MVERAAVNREVAGSIPATGVRLKERQREENSSVEKMDVSNSERGQGSLTYDLPFSMEKTHPNWE